MRRLYIGTLILLITLFCGLLIGVSATTESGTATINEEEYYTWKITLQKEGKLSYEINVTNELLIDVILYDEENYNIFLDGQPCNYVQEGTDLFTTNAKKSVKLPSGTYYLVADNTQEGLAIPDWDDDENNTATIDYTVTYTLSEEDSWWNILILGGIIVTIIIVIVVIMKKKK
jgi:hypothetical protein